MNQFADLGPDELVAQLESVAGETPDLVALAGFLGEAHGEGSEDRVRLYADPSLHRWIEFERTAIVKRERLRHDRGALAPLTVIWVHSAVLEQEFEGVPARLELEFLNDRAELWIEPPRNVGEAVEYMKLFADYFYGMTKRTSRWTGWHC